MSTTALRFARCAGVVSLTVLAALAGTADAQWAGTQTNGTIVDANYTPSASGKYRFYANRSANSSSYNFSVSGRRIPMADPTLLKIGDWYYVTGTTDAAAGQTNFAIYRSRNLVSWQPHMLAFRETSSTTYNAILSGPFNGSSYGSSTKVINGRTFRDCWAPQLYTAPDLPNTVWLSFTAREGANVVLECDCSAVKPPQSVHLVSIPKSSFIAGGQGNYFTMTAPWEPLTYFYRTNNTGAGQLDGGYQQGHTIPVTGSLAGYNPCSPSSCGVAYFAGRQFNDPHLTTWGHSCMGSNTWMALDSFMYLDPLDIDFRNNQPRRWMMYTWTEGFNTDWNGNHVAAYSMLDDRQMDAFGSHLPIAYRYHWWYWPAQNFCAWCAPETLAWPNPNPRDCWLLNGVSGADGTEMTGVCEDNYAVAEGPAAFNRNGYTYVLYSRNAWDSPAYGIFYRFAKTRFANMGLPAWNDYTTPEYPLVWATQTWWRNDRAIPYGKSFGHGEVFAGPTPPGEAQKYYLVFHAKQQGPSYPGKYSGRTVYFKELTFNSDASIRTLQNDSSAGLTDTEGFLIPK